MYLDGGIGGVKNYEKALEIRNQVHTEMQILAEQPSQTVTWLG